MDPSLFPQRAYAQQQHTSFDHAHAPEAASPRDQLQIPVRMALDAFIQHNAGLTPADMGTLMAHLEQLMRDCSEANIQTGKNWIVNHCQNPQQFDLMSRALVAISISRVTFNDKLHIIYLVNDILSHSERKQQYWIKEALLPHLVPILRVAYYFPGSDDGQRQRVMKVLDIWRNKEFFPPYVVDTMETSVKRPPVVPPPPVGAAFPGSGIPMNNPIADPTHPHRYPQQNQHQQHHQQHPQAPYPPHPQHTPYPQPLHQQHPPPPQQLTTTWPPINPYMTGPSNGPNNAYPPHPNYPHPYGQPHGGQAPQSPLAFNPHGAPSPQQPPFHQHFQHQQQSQDSHLAPQQVAAAYVTPPRPPPAPTHHEVLTRDLPAGVMMSKIESDSDYYEPLPAYVSVPIQRHSSEQEAMTAAVTDFVTELSALELSGETAKTVNEGWKDGSLEVFYKTTAAKRKQVYSEDSKQPGSSSRRSRSRSPQTQERGRPRIGSRGREKSRSASRRSPARASRHSRSYSNSRSYSRSRSRSPRYHRRSRSRSRARSLSRGGSRSRSRSGRRSRSRSRSKNRGNGRTGSSIVDNPFPARSFSGLGASGGQGSGGASRPVFQPARHN